MSDHIKIMAVSRRFVIEELDKKRIFTTSAQYSEKFRDFLCDHFDRHDEESRVHFKTLGGEVASNCRFWMGRSPAAKAANKSRKSLKAVLESSHVDFFDAPISPPEIKKKKSPVGAPKKAFEELRSRTSINNVAKNIIGDNSVKAVMAAASFAAKDGGCPDESFVIHQMSAHPELAARIKEFIKNPPKRTYFSIFSSNQTC